MTRRPNVANEEMAVVYAVNVPATPKSVSLKSLVIIGSTKKFTNKVICGDKP